MEREVRCRYAVLRYSNEEDTCKEFSVQLYEEYPFCVRLNA